MRRLKKGSVCLCEKERKTHEEKEKKKGREERGRSITNVVGEELRNTKNNIGRIIAIKSTFSSNIY